MDRDDHEDQGRPRVRFEAMGGGTLARSEESWEGLIASMLKGYSRRTLDKGIRNVLAHLKTEAEHRTSMA
jgi:hypothetical protein